MLTRNTRMNWKYIETRGTILKKPAKFSIPPMRPWGLGSRSVKRNLSFFCSKMVHGCLRIKMHCTTFLSLWFFISIWRNNSVKAREDKALDKRYVSFQIGRIRVSNKCHHCYWESVAPTVSIRVYFLILSVAFFMIRV